MSKYSIISGPERVFSVKVPSSIGAVRYKKGDRLKIGWKQKDTMVFPS
jgi:hypothetical protein